MSVDLSGCIIAQVLNDGEIKTLYKAEAWIDNKQGAGGQSHARFEKLRQGQILQWYKNINEQLMKLEITEIILDMQIVYSNQLIKQLHNYNKAKIERIISSGYSGSHNGIHQTIKLIEKEKK